MYVYTYYWLFITFYYIILYYLCIHIGSKLVFLKTNHKNYQFILCFIHSEHDIHYFIPIYQNHTNDKNVNFNMAI